MVRSHSTPQPPSSQHRSHFQSHDYGNSVSTTIQQALQVLFTEQCYDEIFVHMNFFDMDCMKITLSKLIGYSILVGSLLVKVPQIVKIKWNKSGHGVSVIADTIMLAAIFGSMAYGFTSEYPLSSYGDSYFLFIQTIIIIVMVLYYEKKYVLAGVYLILCLLLTVLMFKKLIPEWIIWNLAATSMILSVTSRLYQAYCNYRIKSTGNLSAISMLMLFFGSLARIFTSIQETGDHTLIWTYILNTIANGILILQLGYYWSATTTTTMNDEHTETVKQKKKE
ncbi:unnamed protein product [Didymodactylos carnosus]|uniref:Mannose-P-dolichol utilization defect 1 protein homolog n=1 Tax=Didymodactylos carnosus TaxID=1234261 RepID=A0A814A4X5_9BILA|nr:unnamed protein product [Didymodactylos carnosus]CAF0906934.1 unnamed protein product [Didymodactylos carnosus]CAF3599528.1 unnamed protein product [Didymodactylos carnosus]CAF3688556.1 unnamed protein product [Didymodactylos carnosus]